MQSDTEPGSTVSGCQVVLERGQIYFPKLQLTSGVNRETDLSPLESFRRNKPSAELHWEKGAELFSQAEDWRPE